MVGATAEVERPGFSPDSGGAGNVAYESPLVGSHASPQSRSDCLTSARSFWRSHPFGNDRESEEPWEVVSHVVTIEAKGRPTFFIASLRDAEFVACFAVNQTINGLAMVTPSRRDGG